MLTVTNSEPTSPQTLINCRACFLIPWNLPEPTRVTKPSGRLVYLGLRTRCSSKGLEKQANTAAHVEAAEPHRRGAKGRKVVRDVGVASQRHHSHRPHEPPADLGADIGSYGAFVLTADGRAGKRCGVIR